MREMSMVITVKVPDEVTEGEVRRHVHSLLRPDLGTPPELGNRLELVAVHRPVVDDPASWMRT